MTIPVLDLRHLHGSTSERGRFVDTLGGALTEVGFFGLTGHGVPDDDVARLYALAGRLFELPGAVKDRHERPELMGQRGFTRFGREHAKDHPAPDLKEYFSIGPDLPRSPYPANIWPEELPELRAAAQDMFRRLLRVAGALLEAVAEVTGEPRRLFADMVQEGDSLLRIIHYPPIPADADPRSVRAAAHEDINLITLLVGASADGLELQGKDGAWRPVQAVPGQLVVNVGDMLQHLTNGVLRSTTHRVVNPGDSRARRYSMPFFVHPRPDVDLTPRAGCIARAGGEVRYGRLTAGQFLRQRLEELGLAKARS